MRRVWERLRPAPISVCIDSNLGRPPSGTDPWRAPIEVTGGSRRGLGRAVAPLALPAASSWSKRLPMAAASPRGGEAPGVQRARCLVLVLS